jgi:hypothetical protein
MASANPTAMAMARFAEGEAFTDATWPGHRPPWRMRCGGPGRSATGSSPAPPSPRWWPCAAATAPRTPALALFRDAIGHWRTSRNRTLLVTTLRNLVVLLARTGQDEAAAALAATVQAGAPSGSYGAEAARISTALAAVRRRLGAAAYDGAWAAGTTRTLEEAAEDALRLLGPGTGGAAR